MSDWKSELDGLFRKKDDTKKTTDERALAAREEIRAFFEAVAVPAFEELRSELEKHGRTAQIHSGAEEASISVINSGELELRFTLKTKIWPENVYVYPEQGFTDKSDGKTYNASGGSLKTSSNDSVIGNITKDDIIKCFLDEYKLLSNWF